MMNEDTYYHEMSENEGEMDKVIRNIYSECDTTKTGKVQVSKLIDFMKPYFKANQSDLAKLQEIMDPDNDDHEVSNEMFITLMTSWATKYNQEDSFHNISQQDFNNPCPLVESTPRKSFGARQQRVYAEAAALDVSIVEQESTVASNGRDNSLERSILEEHIKQLTHQNKKCHDELMLARSQLLSQEEQNLFLQSEVDRLNRDLKHDHDTIESLMKESQTLDDLRDNTLSKQRCIEKIEKQVLQYEKENQQLKVENSSLERERAILEEKLVRTHDNLAKSRKETIELRAEINMKEAQISLAEEAKIELISKINDLKDTVSNVQESNNCLTIEKEKVAKLLQENLKRQQVLMNMTVSSPREYTPNRKSTPGTPVTPQQHENHTNTPQSSTRHQTTDLNHEERSNLHNKHITMHERKNADVMHGQEVTFAPDNYTRHETPTQNLPNSPKFPISSKFPKSSNSFQTLPTLPISSPTLSTSYKLTDSAPATSKTHLIPFVSPITTNIFKFYNKDSPIAKRSPTTSQLENQPQNVQTLNRLYSPPKPFSPAVLTAITNNQSPSTPADVTSPPNMYVVERTNERKAPTLNISFDESATEEELFQVQYTSTLGASTQLSLMDELAAFRFSPTTTCDACKDRFQIGKRLDDLCEQIEWLKHENSALRKSDGQLHDLIETNRQLEDANKKKHAMIEGLMKEIEEFRIKEVDLKKNDEDLKEAMKKEEQLLMKLQESCEFLERKVREESEKNQELQAALDEYRNAELVPKENCNLLEEKLAQSIRSQEELAKQLEETKGQAVKIMDQCPESIDSNELQEKSKALETLQKALEVLKAEQLELKATIEHEQAKVMSVTEELIISESSKKSLERQFFLQKEHLLAEHKKEIQLERTKALHFNDELQSVNKCLEIQVETAVQERANITFEYQMQLEDITNKWKQSKEDIEELEKKYYHTYDSVTSLTIKNEHLSNDRVKLYLLNEDISDKLEEAKAELQNINALITFNAEDESLPLLRKIELLIKAKDKYDELQQEYEELLKEKYEELEKLKVELHDLEDRVQSSNRSKSDMRKTPYDRSQIKLERLKEKVDHLQDVVKEERCKRAFLETEVANLQKGKLALLKVNEDNQMSFRIQQNELRDLTKEVKELLMGCFKLKEVMFKLWRNVQHLFDKTAIEALFGGLREDCEMAECEELKLDISQARSELMTIDQILRALANQNVDDIKMAQVKTVSTMAWVMRSANLSRPMSPDSPNLEALEAAQNQPTCAGDIGLMDFETSSANEDYVDGDLDPIEDLNNLYLIDNLEFLLTTIRMEYTTPLDLESFVDEFALTFMLDCAGYNNRLRSQFEKLKGLVIRLIGHLQTLSSLFQAKNKRTSAFKKSMVGTVRSIFDLTQSAEQFGAIRQEYQRSTTLKHLITNITQLRLNLDKIQKHCQCAPKNLNSEMVYLESVGASTSFPSNQLARIVPERVKKILHLVRPRNFFRLVGVILFLYAVYLISTPFLLIVEPERFPLCWSPWLDFLAAYFKRQHPDGIPPT